MTESQIQETIVAWLSMISRRYGFLFFSVPNEGALTAAMVGKAGHNARFGMLMTFKKMGLTPGAADLIIGHRGKMFALEVKTERGKQSDRQAIFSTWCADCGIPYRIVRSLDDVQAAMVEWGIVAQSAPGGARK
jgi:hypothetical protein